MVMDRIFRFLRRAGMNGEQGVPGSKCAQAAPVPSDAPHLSGDAPVPVAAETPERFDAAPGPHGDADMPEPEPEGVGRSETPVVAGSAPPIEPEKIENYEVHPAAALFREMNRDEFEGLKESIRREGQKVPIVTYRGQVLDGRNRLKICVELGIDPKFTDLDPNVDPYEYSRCANLSRRHLSPVERAFLAAQEASLERGQKSNAAGAAFAQDDLAKQFGCSPDSIQRAKKILSSGVHELAEAVKSGAMSLALGAEISGLAPEAQRKAMASPDRNIAAGRRSGRKRGRKKQSVEPKGIPESVEIIETDAHFVLEVGDGWENQVSAAMANHPAFERAIEKGLLIVRRKVEGEDAA